MAVTIGGIRKRFRSADFVRRRDFSRAAMSRFIESTIGAPYSLYTKLLRDCLPELKAAMGSGDRDRQCEAAAFIAVVCLSAFHAWGDFDGGKEAVFVVSGFNCACNVLAAYGYNMAAPVDDD